MRSRVTVDAAQGMIRSTVARALGQALILGIDNANEEERPLTQLQQIDIATMHVMAYDEALKSCDYIKVMSDLERIATR